MHGYDGSLDESVSRIGVADRRDTLEHRLEEGFAKIEDARRSGRDFASWERVWFELLREYEDVCDELREAA